MLCDYKFANELYFDNATALFEKISCKVWGLTTDTDLQIQSMYTKCIASD